MINYGKLPFSSVVLPADNFAAQPESSDTGKLGLR
jgi:hypothetical protein